MDRECRTHSASCLSGPKASGIRVEDDMSYCWYWLIVRSLTSQVKGDEICRHLYIPRNDVAKWYSGLITGAPFTDFLYAAAGG